MAMAARDMVVLVLAFSWRCLLLLAVDGGALWWSVECGVWTYMVEQSEKVAVVR